MELNERVTLFKDGQPIQCTHGAFTMDTTTDPVTSDTEYTVTFNGLASIQVDSYNLLCYAHLIDLYQDEADDLYELCKRQPRKLKKITKKRIAILLRIVAAFKELSHG